jgi:hypothetical protein
MISYRGIIAALGIATHDNVPKVVLGSQEDSGQEPRGAHQEVPWEASNFFSRDVIKKSKLKLISFDQSKLRREIKETQTDAKQGLRALFAKITRNLDDKPGRARVHC